MSRSWSLAALAAIVVLVPPGCRATAPAGTGAAAPGDPARPSPPATTASDDGPADVTGAGVTPRAYHLELAIDPEATGFTGTVTIDVDVAVRTRTIWLDARELEISSVRVVRPGAAGAPDEQLEATEATGAPTGKVGITLARPLPPGPARVELRFAGLYRLDDGLFAQTYRAHTYAFSDFEPLDARRAFPCFDEPRFKTPWTVSLVVPHGLVALSNTAAETTTRLDRDLDRVDFATTPPLPSYLVAVAVGPFDLVDVDGGPVPMRLVVPQGRRAAAERARVIAPQIVAAAAELLDRRVPFDKLDFIAVPRFGGAMENPGLITVSAGILLDATDDAAERRLALVIAHETSHLWFGDWMTLEDWRDLWIQEGVASWMADEVLARWRPGWHTRRGELKSRGEAMREDALPDAHPLRPDELDGPRALFDVLTYQKAAAVLHMFEAWVGEDAFLDGLRGLLDDRPWGHATTTDLVAALASAAGDGDRVDATRAAVTSFLARPGIPVIEAELQCGGEARVRLHLREPGWAVPACVRWGDGAGTHQACAVVDDDRELTLGAGCPDWVHPNADAAGYYRWTLRGARLADTMRGRGVTDRERLDAALAVRGALAADAPLTDVADALAAGLSSDVPEVVEAIAADYALLLDQLAPSRAHKVVAAHLREALAPAVRRLGTAARAGDGDDVRRLRRAVLTAAGGPGADPKLMRWARRIARRYLRGKPVGADDAEAAVLIAASHADRKLAAALLAAAATAPEEMTGPDDPPLLGRALARMPRARALRALDAALDGKLHAGTTFTIAVGLLQRADTATAAADTLARHGDWLAFTLPFAPVCDPALVDRLSGGAARDAAFARVVRKRRVEAQRCDALRGAVTDAARAFAR